MKTILKTSSGLKQILMIGVFSLTALFFNSNSVNAQRPIKNIVLVHGAFADGSSWKAIYDILSKKGFNVSIVQNPLSSLKDDVAATNSVLNRQDGPAILVGHSWGGAVITEAGVHAKVAGLVYIAAFAPDKGETAGQWIGAAPAAPEAGFTPVDEFGLVYFEPSKFHGGFAADLSQAQSDFMATSQVPIKAHSFEEPIENVAWKTKATFGIVATQDKALHPDTERKMYQKANAKITEIKGSHAIFISKPLAVANVIIEAAQNSLYK